MTLLVIHTLDDIELVSVTELVENVETIILYEATENEAQSRS